jgi:hypothetical protein
MDNFLKTISGGCVWLAVMLGAYFETTATFFIALFLAFLFNILAGFRADEVKFRFTWTIPPFIAHNFKKPKLSTSLSELLQILSLIILIKVMADLMDYGEHSKMIVQALSLIAVYWYLRNGLRNMQKAYPKNRFIAMLYYLLAFKYRQFFGDDMADIVETFEEKELKK